MFTRCLFSGYRNVFAAATYFKSYHIKCIETTNVSSSDAMAAEITLFRQKIDLFLESKEVQAKINPKNSLITPMFTLLNTNGSIVDGPKEFNNGNNKLETILAKIPHITINFDNFEKTTNDKWYAYMNITGDFSDYQKHVTQHRNLANIKSKKNETLKWFDDGKIQVIIFLTIHVVFFILLQNSI